MGFLSRAIERKATSLEIWAEMLKAGLSSKAGQTVNLDNALKVATLFACLRVLSQGVAQVPFKLFREQESEGLTKILPARDHKLYDLLSVQPNDWQTSYEFREQLVLHAALGNAYVWKSRVLSGWGEFILLNPGRMEVLQKNEWLPPTYKYTTVGGAVIEYAASEIWHVRGPSWSGFAGLDMLRIAREVLGLAMALDESAAKLHANGAQPSGVYSVDGVLNDSQQKQLLKWIKAETSGDNAGNALVLDRGAKWLSTAMTSIDAQALESRKHQIEEVCRFMGVAPLMVGYSDKATTYASAEQMFLAHTVHTLSPWYARLEQSADINLLTKQERNKGYYTKFMAAGLMRGAAKDRAEFYAKALGSGGHPGWMTPDEVRAFEELNPMGGEAGKLPAPSSKQTPAEPDAVPA